MWTVTVMLKKRTCPRGPSGKATHDLSESREKSYTHIVMSKVRSSSQSKERNKQPDGCRHTKEGGEQDAVKCGNTQLLKLCAVIL